MKKCPVCQQTYTDENLNFCLNDGGTLQPLRDDPPPTVFMNKPRPTAETNWSNANQTNPWGNPPNANQPHNWMSPHASQSPAFMPPPQINSQSPSLAIASLILGICSFIFGLCFYLGIPLSGAALVTGYMALNKANNDPTQSGGRGLAIAGMITGAVGLLISMGIFLLYLIGSLK